MWKHHLHAASLEAPAAEGLQDVSVMSSISRDVPLIFSTATLLLHFARLSNYLLNEYTNKRSIYEVLITSHFVSYNSGKKIISTWLPANTSLPHKLT